MSLASVFDGVLPNEMNLAILSKLVVNSWLFAHLNQSPSQPPRPFEASVVKRVASNKVSIFRAASMNKASSSEFLGLVSFHQHLCLGLPVLPVPSSSESSLSVVWLESFVSMLLVVLMVMNWACFA